MLRSVWHAVSTLFFITKRGNSIKHKKVLCQLAWQGETTIDRTHPYRIPRITPPPPSFIFYTTIQFYRREGSQEMAPCHGMGNNMQHGQIAAWAAAIHWSAGSQELCIKILDLAAIQISKHIRISKALGGWIEISRHVISQNSSNLCSRAGCLCCYFRTARWSGSPQPDVRLYYCRWRCQRPYCRKSAYGKWEK